MYAYVSEFEVQHEPQWLWQTLLVLILAFVLLSLLSLVVIELVLPLMFGINIAYWVTPALMSAGISACWFCVLVRGLFISDHARCLHCQQPAICRSVGFLTWQFVCNHCGRQT